MKKSSEHSVLVIGTCLQPKGKTILKSHDSHSKSVALFVILLKIYLKNRISNPLRENQIELLVLGIEPVLKSTTNITVKFPVFQMAEFRVKIAIIGYRFSNVLTWLTS